MTAPSHTYEKPAVDLIGSDGNVFMLLGRCTRALKQAGQPEAAKELTEKVTSAGSYDEALRLMMAYVDVQ